MKLGEHYTGTNHKVFEILELYTQDDQPWVNNTLKSNNDGWSLVNT